MINLQNKSPRLLVIGDLMIDQYLWGTCERISPEAPVQVINVDHESTVLGGAGNVVNNLKKLGAQVDVISVVGNCEISNELISLLSDIEVDTKYLITQKNRITSKKSRIIASQQQVVRYDRESTDEIDIESQSIIINTFKKIIENYEVILLSDYGKGVLTKKLTQSLINFAKKSGKKMLIDPKGLDYSKYKGAYLLAPNKKEASEATQIDIKDGSSLTQAIVQLKLECELEVSLITLSEQGVAIYDNELRIHPTVTREVFDVTGAGDTILASVGFVLACDFDIDEAIKFFNHLELDSMRKKISEKIIFEISSRLKFLNNVGLKYLTLSRSAETLSGGESQRIRLASQIGSGLTGVMYVLDEPSIGLHQRDNDRLLKTLKNLPDLGNTVIVVEHDEDTIII